jgi:tRNA (guanine-N7-)-methyltransferase
MPHFVATKLQDIQYPSSFEDVTYEYKVDSQYDDLISVSINKKSFFLIKCKNTQNQIIVKPERYTRIPQVSLIQQAIKGYMLLSKADIISQNILVKKYKTKDCFLFAIKNSYFFIDFFQNIKKNIKIHIEIGFGSGRHILDKAIKNPNDIFIGLELHTPSIEQVSKLAYSNNIQNLYIGRFDARIFLEMLPSNSIETIFVHFPVPWDKKPHRRVYSIDFLHTVTRILNKNATLELRTDSDNYYNYVLNLFTQINASIEIKKNEPINIQSKYEDRWREQNKEIYDVIYTNTTISEEIHTNIDFSFSYINKNTINIDNISNNIHKFDNYFVHFKNIYKNSKENLMLIKVSFGNFNQVENNYIMIKDDNINYISKPIPSRYNIKSHIEIIKLLNISL